MSLFCGVSVATLPFRAARSPPASLQTGSQRVTFGGSHQFSRLISFSSTWALSAITPSSNLVSLLESEIESSIVNPDAPNNDGGFPEWFPFQMIDLPNERVVQLIRQFGDETVLVIIDPSAPLDDAQPKVPQDDEELLTGIPMAVSVWKDENGLSLDFGVKAFANEIIIGSVAVEQPDDLTYPYKGADFDDLDENLQKAFHKYLEIRGINLTLTHFLADYMVDKDKREHLQWLKDVKSFVLTCENSQ